MGTFRIAGALNDRTHPTERKVRGLAENQARTTGEPVGIERLDAGTWQLFAVVQLTTWTFRGHWTGGDRIEVTEILEGLHEDDRTDNGDHAGGLWSDSGTGFDRDVVMAEVIAPYEDDIHSRH